MASEFLKPNSSSTQQESEMIWGKTPKAWLTEIFAKRKLPPADWSHRELQKIPSKFMATCVIRTMDGNVLVKVEGIGGTKKESEHRASREALKGLGITERDLYEMTPAGKQKRKQEQAKPTFSVPSSDSVDNGFMSDSDEEVQGEPVGNLITLCRRQNLNAEPLYEEVHKMGPFNTNIFTVTCTVGSLSCKSARRSRKAEAKKRAAYKVLKDLEAKLSKTRISPQKACQVTSTVVGGAVDIAEDTASSSSASSALSAPSSPSSSFTQVNGNNPLKRELDRTMAKAAGNADSHSSSSSEAEDQRMQMDDDDIDENIKRKLLEEEDVLNGQDVSKRCRLLELQECDDNSCLKFITNYCLIFQHLPTSSTVDKTLATRDLIKNLEAYGGALAVLQNVAKKSNIRMSFTQSVALADLNVVVFLSIKLPKSNFKNVRQRNHVVNGVGKTRDEAKLQASVAGLRLLDEF